MPRRPVLVSGGLVSALVLAAGAMTLLPGATPPAAADVLVPYTGCGELLQHYRAELARHATAYGPGPGLAVADGVRPMPVAGRAEGAGGDLGAVGSGPSGTNLQERGVDEPDAAKIVDGLLYVVARNRLQVLRAGASPELLSSLPLGDGAFGAELLVQGDRVLVVVPGGYVHSGAAVDLPAPALDSFRVGSFPGGGGPTTTRLVLVDVADPRDPRVLEELELGGRYLSARLSGGAVRVVTIATPAPAGATPRPPYGPAQERAALAANVQAARSVTLADVLPRNVRRAAGGRVFGDGPAVGCRGVRYSPSSRGASTLVVTTLDPARDLAPTDATAVTTDGELVYASAERLYVATSRWGTSAPPGPERPATSTVSLADRVTTELHAFALDSSTSTSYAGSTSVDGYVMGRWALSSYEGHLRVATTSSPPWGEGPPSASRVTVLRERPDGLVETGRVDGLGIGERIFAVRYFGGLATVVTFRQTDPLYVLDLADPGSPRLVGALKVPGFSTYLHPVGRDRLLGVGQDADADGRVTGAALSLFDLSDRSRPVQLDRMSLGQGYTPAGEDSRAFGFDPARSTALLPYAAYTVDGGTSSALAVRVTEDGSLVEAGRLQTTVQAPVERVLHDGAHVYAVTQEGVLAATAGDLRRTGGAAFTD